MKVKSKQNFNRFDLSSSRIKLSPSDNILIDGRETKTSIVDIVSALMRNKQ